MQKKYIMALDQGTTSSRCILFDKSGKICSMAQREFEQIYPNPGWVEHNPMEIWSSQLGVVTEALAKIGADAEEIAALGITNQRETTIVWNRHTGEPVYNAIVWQCHRTAGMVTFFTAGGLVRTCRPCSEQARYWRDCLHRNALLGDSSFCFGQSLRPHYRWRIY